MIIRRLAAMLGVGCLLALAACENNPPATLPPSSPTALPAVTLSATAPPVLPTATTVPAPASATPANAPTILAVILPTATSVPPTPTPVSIAPAFAIGLDQARLDALYAQALQQAQAAAPDAKLSHVRLMLVAFARPPLIAFDFYATGSGQLYQAQALDGGEISKLDKSAAPSPAPPTFDTPPWQRDPTWPARIAQAATQAHIQPDPAHGRWQFTLDADPNQPDWQVAIAGTFLYTLVADKVSEQPALPGQTPGAAVPAPAGSDIPFNYTPLNNAAVDRYYVAASRLVTAKGSATTIRAVDLRFGDPADAGEAAILYHFYIPGQKQNYLATFDTGGRRDITPESLPAGASKTVYRTATLPWKTAPAWPGLMQVAAQALADQPADHVRMLLTATAATPATWDLTTTVVYP